MTRPQIIRADTLDLQDKTSPTAQDHSHQPTHPAPLGVGPAAPHQEASLRRVDEERSSEEAQLQNGAWHDGNALRDDPGSDDERTVVTNGTGDSKMQQDEQAVRLNGGMTGDGDDGDMQDADVEEDMDDDMMDKISSSPSIDDASPDLHHRGEYAWAGTTGGNFDNPDSGDDSPEVSPRTEHLRIIELRLQRLQSMRQDSQASLTSESDEEKMLAMLKPLPSPTLDYQKSPGSPGISKGHPLLDGSDHNEEDEWTTDSDADSWDMELDPSQDENSKDVSFSDDPRFIDSGWGGECLRETEDIDFEFVYALHTFVATVEGQANATKGDTMVLLDDSNSYWWLVRVVKDSSIGYLPAEHIETPTERLARLNKHRNIDLSATMLGDTAEKSKNPLKKAMRRRNAKTVQFAAPTYVEASDYDYSSDEDNDELFGGADPTQQAQQQQKTAEQSESQEDDSLKVQPLKLGGGKNDANGDQETESRAVANDATKDEEKASEDLDKPLDPKVTRNGTLRNTDSFFKDENTETRKITLTPNLLRDDSSTSTTGSRERGPSLESLEKNGFADKVKDDKKKKEKKPGMLSGLFKRKDKKNKGSNDLNSVDSDVEKQSEEINRSSPQPKPSDDLSPERPSAEQSAAAAPTRQASKGKLQKMQRPREDSPPKKGILKTESSEEPAAVQPAATKEASNDKPATQQATMRLVQPEPDETTKSAIEERALSPESRSKTNKLNPMNVLKGQSSDEPRPEKVKKAKQRVQLDDFDSEDDVKADPFADPDSQNNVRESEDSEPAGRLSESPVHITAADAQPPQERELESDSQHPPGLTGDTSSQETSSPVSTPTPDDSPTTTAPTKPTLSTSHPANVTSPTTLSPASTVLPPPSRPAPIPTKEMEASPPASSESTTLPAWSDASLRTYLDDGSDIRDMLVVINDTTGVVPVGPEHPIMSRLFVEESKAVQGLSGQLDTLLNGLLDKRMKRLGMGSSKTGTKAGPARF